MKGIVKIYILVFALASMFTLYGVTYADDVNIKLGSTGDAFRVKDPGSASLMTVLGSGNVGIGTTSPVERLDVNGNINSSGGFFASDGSAGSPVFSFIGSTDLGMFSPIGQDLGFTTGGSEKARITNDGNVGIGTTNPVATLDVKDTSALDADLIFKAEGNHTTHNLVLTGTGTVGIGTTSPSGSLEVNPDGIATNGDEFVINSTGRVGIGTTNPTTDLFVLGGTGGYISLDAQSMTNLVLSTGSAPARWTISARDTGDLTLFEYPSNIHHVFFQKTTGNVGIGNSLPNVALDVVGSIEYTGTITDVSDERLKENIKPISGALKKIQAIDGVYYNMIDEPERTEIGVIAQEVMEVLPEVVSVVDEENEYLGVSYTSIVPVLIAAVKELKAEKDAEIATLKAENKQLRETLTAMVDRQKSIEDMLLALSATSLKEKLVKLDKINIDKVQKTNQ